MVWNTDDKNLEDRGKLLVLTQIPNEAILPMSAASATLTEKMERKY